jgi:hypothetical protein
LLDVDVPNANIDPLLFLGYDHKHIVSPSSNICATDEFTENFPFESLTDKAPNTKDDNLLGNAGDGDEVKLSVPISVPLYAVPPVPLFLESLNL